MDKPQVLYPDLLQIISHRKRSKGKKYDTTTKQGQTHPCGHEHKTNGFRTCDDLFLTKDVMLHQENQAFSCIYCGMTFSNDHRFFQHLLKMTCSSQDHSEVKKTNTSLCSVAVDDNRYNSSCTAEGDNRQSYPQSSPPSLQEVRSCDIEPGGSHQVDSNYRGISANTVTSNDTKLEIEITNEYEMADDPQLYIRRRSLRERGQQVSPMKIYSCVQCGETFNERSELSEHWDIHNKEGLLLENSENLRGRDGESSCIPSQSPMQQERSDRPGKYGEICKDSTPFNEVPVNSSSGTHDQVDYRWILEGEDKEFLQALQQEKSVVYRWMKT